MGVHKASDHDARKKKYQNQFLHTERNKSKHKAKMLALNPNWPNKKEKHNGKDEGNQVQS